MTDIPDAAIEAAARAIGQHYLADRKWHEGAARAAIEAAMPAIREAIAQEIEAIQVRWSEHLTTSTGRPINYVLDPQEVQTRAARIVRGGAG